MQAKIAGLILAAALAAGSGLAQKRGSRDVKYEETSPPNAQAVIPRGYALIVGIAHYKNLPAKSQLQFSEADAEAMYSALIDPEGGNFRAEDVHRLIGAKATLANLKQELEVWLPSAAKADDRVVIYFAGNGFVKDGGAYLAPYDVDPAKITATGYPVDELASMAEKIQAKNKILITDSCHSGTIAADDDARAYNKRLLDLSASMFSLTASRDSERSLEGPDWGGGHGVFTYYAAKGLEGEADENADGIVTADKLANYAYRNVREATKDQQNPADHGSSDRDMLLAYIPAGLRLANLSPSAAAANHSGPDCSAPELSDLCTLLSKGAAEEVIRRLDPKAQHKKPATAALPLLAQAYRMQAEYPRAIEAARAAIKLAPEIAESHLWLADSLRLSVKAQESEPEYFEYLRLSGSEQKPESGAIDHLLAYLTQTGHKKVDAGTEEWRDMRSLAYMGLCQAERDLMHFTTAIGYCQKSLAYDKTDPSAHYALALCYMHEAQANGSLEMLAAAQQHFRRALALDPQFEQAKSVQANLRNVDMALAPPD